MVLQFEHISMNAAHAAVFNTEGAGGTNRQVQHSPMHEWTTVVDHNYDAAMCMDVTRMRVPKSKVRLCCGQRVWLKAR